MADRGLIQCLSQPIGGSGLRGLNFNPDPAALGKVDGPSIKAEIPYEPSLTVTVLARESDYVSAPIDYAYATEAPVTTNILNRGSTDAPGVLPVGGTKLTQYWG